MAQFLLSEIKFIWKWNLKKGEKLLLVKSFTYKWKDMSFFRDSTSWEKLPWAQKNKIHTGYIKSALTIKALFMYIIYYNIHIAHSWIWML